MMDLYSDIKAKVEASGFTWAAVCDRAEVSPSTVTNWSRPDGSKPNQTTYDRMIGALAEMVRERDQKMQTAGLK